MAISAVATNLAMMHQDGTRSDFKRLLIKFKSKFTNNIYINSIP
jgi:hypothetical protein